LRIFLRKLVNKDNMFWLVLHIDISAYVMYTKEALESMTSVNER